MVDMLSFSNPTALAQDNENMDASLNSSMEESAPHSVSSM